MIKNIVNVTPHFIRFEVGSELVEIPSSGVVINARPEEKVVRTVNGATFVKTIFEPTTEGQAQINGILEQNPDAIIVGSIIAAQAYPGQVVGMIAATGFERATPDLKRYRVDKFATF